MKKAHIFLSCFIAVFLLSACYKKDAGHLKEIVTETSEKISDGPIITNEKTSDDEIDTDRDQIPVKDSESVQLLEIDEDYAILVDIKLKGIDLIKAAKVVNPIEEISYDVKTIDFAGDMIYKTIGSMTKIGNSYKKITEFQGNETQNEGKKVTIYNADEKMMYQYFEATMKGYKYREDFKISRGPVFEGEYVTTLYAEGSNLIEAEVIEYNGDAIMFFAFQEGNIKVASWVSLKYGITIRSEVYDSNDQIQASVEISNIHKPEVLDNDYFMPPKEVIFEDYSNGGIDPESLVIGNEE